MAASNAFRIHMAELGAASGAAETSFLAIGRMLEQAISVLARQAQAVGTLRTGMQGAGLTGAIDALAHAASEISALAGHHADVQVAIDGLAAAAAVIGGRIASMQTVTRDVDMLALHARLAASAMGPQGADFMIFADEIRRSAELAVGQLDRIRGELDGAARHLCAAREAVLGFAARHGEALVAIPARLAANVEQFSARGGLAVVAAAQVGDRSEEIRRQLAVQIGALQFGDITRQRIEHVCAGAALLADAGEGDGAPGGLGRRLLAAQLLDIADELDTESEAIIAGLGALASAVRDIRRINGHAYGASDDQVGSFVAALEADVRRTQALVANLQGADAAMAERAAAVLEATHRLAQHVATVRTVEADIRIMGLNTTLKCSRLGVVGRPLGVVAQELREFGTRTAAYAASVLQALDAMTAQAVALGETNGSRRQGAIGDVVVGMRGAVGVLQELGQVLSDALAGLETDTEAVAGLLEAAAAGFAVRHDIGAVLRRIGSELDAQAGEVGGAAERIGEPGRDLLARIAASYTMARERELHAAVVPWAAVAPPPVAAAALEDMLF